MIDGVRAVPCQLQQCRWLSHPVTSNNPIELLLRLRRIHNRDDQKLVIRTLQWGGVDIENRCIKWGKDKTASGTGRVVPPSQRVVAALRFWATHFPERYVFPAERYGAAGDKFCVQEAYNFDPCKPIGSSKEAWEAARLRAAKILNGESEEADSEERIVPLSCRFHDLRHTAVSRMLNAGTPIAKVAKIWAGVHPQWSAWQPGMVTSL